MNKCGFDRVNVGCLMMTLRLARTQFIVCYVVLLPDEKSEHTQVLDLNCNLWCDERRTSAMGSPNWKSTTLASTLQNAPLKNQRVKFAFLWFKRTKRMKLKTRCLRKWNENISSNCWISTPNVEHAFTVKSSTNAIVLAAKNAALQTWNAGNMWNMSWAYRYSRGFKPFVKI